MLGGVWFSLSFFGRAISSLRPLEDLGLDSNAERAVEDLDFFMRLSSSFSNFFFGDLTLSISAEVLNDVKRFGF